MNIRVRLLLLLVALGSTLLLGIGVGYRDDQAQTARLLRSARADHEAIIDRITGLYGRDLETFAADYSRWTDLGDDIARPRKGWPEANVDGGLISFSANAVWIFDPKGRAVHFAAAKGSESLRPLGDGPAAPSILAVARPLGHYYARWGERTVEVRAARVVQSDDDDRRGPARGYLMVARVWSPAHRLALAKVLGARVEILPAPAADTDPALTHERRLDGPDGRPVARLRVVFPDSPLVHLDDDSRGEALRVLAGAVAILGVFLAFALAWVSQPLKLIANSLAAGRPEPVESLARRHDEFGQIGRLVLDSFAFKHELKTREEQKTAVLESAIDAVITMDAEGRILEFNQSAEGMFGVARADVVGRNLGDVVIPERFRAMHKQGVMRHRGALSKRVEIAALRRDGTEFPVEISLICVPQGETRTYTGFIRDLSEQRRLEEQLRNAQKMESVGLLASGVAHEINTPMQYVLDNTKFLAEGTSALAELLEEYGGLRAAVADEPRFAERAARLAERETALDAAFLLEEMPLAAQESMRGIDRVRKIVRAMRQMAHPGEETMRPTALNGVLDDALALVRNEAKAVADLDLRLDPNLPDVLCDSGEIAQVVVNLVVNALHAIADQAPSTRAEPGKRGTIVVETRMAKDSVEIAVKDDGPGIPDAIRHRVFDPFFTTKPVGKGTGQGLSIVFSIVKRHGGAVEFSNNRDGGTTFVVSLPVARAVAVAA